MDLSFCVLESSSIVTSGVYEDYTSSSSSLFGVGVWLEALPFLRACVVFFHLYSSAMEDSAKLRLVRCPKCQNLLPELSDYSVYQCGGCGAVLRGTIFLFIFFSFLILAKVAVVLI